MRRRALFVVTGASGAGKSTVAPLLAEALRDECVVFDVDLLLDALGNGNAPRFRHAWLSVAHGVAQGGRSTVLCGPLIPEHLQEVPSRKWIGDIHFAALDCPDDVLRERLEARPAWRDSRRHIEEQVGFARWLRANIATTVATGGRAAGEVVADLVRWVGERQ